MNYRTYVKVMIALGEDLERVSSAEPYDEEAFGDVMLSIYRTNQLWMKSRRRHDWISSIFIWMLFGLFCVVILDICC